MDWLKKILENAKLTEDGKLDIDAAMEAIQREFPLHAVPKEVFNDKSKELKTANDMIAELKKSNGDNAELQKKISEYETEIGNLKAEAVNTEKSYALKEALSKAGVLDPDYLIYKAGGLDKFHFDKDNKPVGVEDAVKPYREDKMMTHLFKAAAGTGYTPTGGGNPPAKNPFASDSFNLTEQGRLLRENPEQAKQLAAVAGVTI